MYSLLPLDVIASNPEPPDAAARDVGNGSAVPPEIPSKNVVEKR
jgi:hypothetical protein